jgi:Fe-S-cluster-containing dehydrogenase component
LCIGCKACESACNAANDTPPDTSGDGLHQAPTDLNVFTRNIIKLYKPEDGSPSSFVKRQCMQCFDPGCVAGCPFEALYKDEDDGIVHWDGRKCIGCRYCTIACPYSVPRFQWLGYNPVITKCELCSHRLEKGLKPGCTSVCPVGAVIFGPRTACCSKPSAASRTIPAVTIRIASTAKPTTAARNACICLAFPSRNSACLNRTGVGALQDPALAETHLFLLRAAGGVVCRPGDR